MRSARKKAPNPRDPYTINEVGKNTAKAAFYLGNKRINFEVVKSIGKS